MGGRIPAGEGMAGNPEGVAFLEQNLAVEAYLEGTSEILEAGHLEQEHQVVVAHRKRAVPREMLGERSQQTQAQARREVEQQQLVAQRRSGEPHTRSACQLQVHLLGQECQAIRA